MGKYSYFFIYSDNLPDFKASFPKFKGVNPEIYFKNFDKNGLDLVTKMLNLDPARRISMKEALRHPFFSDLRQEDIDKYRVWLLNWYMH